MYLKYNITVEASRQDRAIALTAMCTVKEIYIKH